LNGQKAQARAYLVSELKLTLEDAETLVSMGSMFIEVGDLGCATHCLLRAIDIDCANADAYYYLGAVSALRGDFEDAAELFAHALDIRNEHIPALRDSALVCLAMGRLGEAASRIEKAHSLEGGDPQLRKLGRSLTLARAKRRVMSALERFGPRI
jgi:tetratricopeptide (TPR) repeat protein